MKKLIDWLMTYRRYYIKGNEIVTLFVVALFFVSVSYWLGYSAGWEDSYQLFDKARPWRPLLG